jgi:hypothetical protein
MAGHAPDISVPHLPKAKVAIISSSWHMDICGDLVAGATRALEAANVKKIKAKEKAHEAKEGKKGEKAEDKREKKSKKK